MRVREKKGDRERKGDIERDRERDRGERRERGERVCHSVWPYSDKPRSLKP